MKAVSGALGAGERHLMIFVLGGLITLTETLIILDITKPNLIIVVLYIERVKQWKSCFGFFTDGKQYKALEIYY